jgi:hypothetical protein
MTERVSTGPGKVFDPTLARHPTRRLRLAQIVDPLHVTDAPNVVASYRSAMLQGDTFPPVATVRLFGIWLLADGHKRFTAYRSLGEQEILVQVWPVSRWLRDQAQQARATVERWRVVLAGIDPAAPRPRELLRAEIAHLRRILASLIRWKDRLRLP